VPESTGVGGNKGVRLADLELGRGRVDRELVERDRDFVFAEFGGGRRFRARGRLAAGLAAGVAPVPNSVFGATTNQTSPTPCPVTSPGAWSFAK
jgi:hypothetical protein